MTEQLENLAAEHLAEILADTGDARIDVTSIGLVSLVMTPKVALRLRLADATEDENAQPAGTPRDPDAHPIEEAPYHAVDEANLACERLEGVIEAEGIEASVDVSSDGWVVVRMSPEVAERLVLNDDEAFVLSEAERRSMVIPAATAGARSAASTTRRGTAPDS